MSIFSCPPTHRASLLGASALALVLSAGPILAQPSDMPSDDAPSVAADDGVLRVCAAAKEAPLSQQDESGFENRIARVLAEAMDRKAVFVWSAKPAIYAERDFLRPRRCDVIVGVDTGDERVLTSKPYYRAPYVFVARKDSELDIETWESPDLAKAEKIGFVPGGPAQVMLTKLGMFNTHFNYMHSLTDFQDRRNKYTRIEPTRMLGDLKSGKADLVVAFAPEIARYVKADPDLTMTVIPDVNERVDGEKVPHHFDQSVGVRRDDKALLEAIDKALDEKRAEIDAILEEEGIPVVTAGSVPASDG
jgi:mxaJ protein